MAIALGASTTTLALTHYFGRAQAFQAATISYPRSAPFITVPSISTSPSQSMPNSTGFAPLQAVPPNATAKEFSAVKTRGIQDSLTALEVPQKQLSNSFPVSELAQSSDSEPTPQKMAPAHQIIQEGAIYLVGITQETSFKNNQYSQDLEELWRQYSESDSFFSLENTVDEKTYVAYSNYSEDGQQFTITIGHRVSSFEGIAADLSKVSIAASPYAQFQVTGDLERSIPATWESIGSASLQRSYSTDLEVYDSSGTDAAQIWVAVD
ncbi:MAG: effector binding domain-containing protein [Cyanobacteria bacterium P01_D01_bin.73]